MPAWTRPLLMLVAAALTACGGGGGGGGGGGITPNPCSVTNQKQFVLDVARDWYLFLELLPATVNLGDYATAEDLLDALTAAARAQGRDRYFSYLTTPQEDSSFLQEGQYIGFGFRVQILGNRMLVPDVYEGSPAADGGMGRGAEVTAIDSGSGYVAIATILATDPNLTQAFGPETTGVERGVRYLRPNGQQVEVRLTKRVVTIPPLPATNGTAVLTLPGNPAVSVGYINLRTFISTAETPLRNAYEQFRAQGIDYFVFDLRYNGGGLLSVAELIGDLNGRNRLSSDIYAQVRFNSRHTANDEIRRFEPQPQSVAPVRIAFITTGGTASASEMVVNSLKPWTEVAIIGGDTYGKPVGQSAFNLTGCDLRLRLVTLKVTNALNQGDYYNGLAGTLPFACAANDDLTRAMGDPAESSTAAALQWLALGACGQIMGAPGPALRAMAAEPEPTPTWPAPRTAAQSWLPGVF
ncbi:MAG: peptidase S41 [Gammaproteobacteria bacterium]|nr:peptidase S41 [Gammaproteobacteria bacterium]